jgi:hypothetical protein
MINPSAAGRPDFDDSPERHFEAIRRQQCLDLIESHHLGRIAWQAADPTDPANHVRHAPGRRLLPYLARWPAGGTRRAHERRASSRRAGPANAERLEYSPARAKQRSTRARGAGRSVGFGFLGAVASGNRTLFIRIRLGRIARPDRATADLTAGRTICPASRWATATADATRLRSSSHQDHQESVCNASSV